MSKNKQQKVTYILITLSIVQVVVIGWLISLQASINIRDQGNERNITQTLNTTSELRFCLDNQISPCDDTAIQQWNNEHPENTFRKN